MTVLDAIKRALMLLGVLREGQPPSSAQGHDALAVLDRLYGHLIETEAFGTLTDVYVSADYAAKENERITLSGDYLVTKPLFVVDDYTHKTRAPLDRSIIVVCGASPERWVYDIEKAAWVALHSLIVSSQLPFGSRFGEGVSAMLAVMLAPEYGLSPSEIVLDMARRGKYSLVRKPNSRVKVSPILANIGRKDSLWQM